VRRNLLSKYQKMKKKVRNSRQLHGQHIEDADTTKFVVKNKAIEKAKSVYRKRQIMRRKRERESVVGKADKYLIEGCSSLMT
jgi:hypothetical protein